MATKPAPKTRPAAAPVSTRKPVTLEMALAVCPHAALAENLARTFGLDPVDSAGIRAISERSMIQLAEALPLSDKALELHLQRLVGAFIGSAFGAGEFYSNKVSEARDLTAKLANEDRDEDRDGVSGFDSKAERARLFAAEKGLQAHALAVAAEGAVAAYAHLTGQDWKPYQAPIQAPATVSRMSASAQIAAFG